MRRQTFLISLISFLRLPATKTMEHHGSHLLPGENGFESLGLGAVHMASYKLSLSLTRDCNLAEKCRPPGNLFSGWDVLVTNDRHYSFGRRTLIWLKKLQIRVLGRVHPGKDRFKDEHNTGSYGPGEDSQTRLESTTLHLTVNELLLLKPPWSAHLWELNGATPESK